MVCLEVLTGDCGATSGVNKNGSRFLSLTNNNFLGFLARNKVLRPNCCLFVGLHNKLIMAIIECLCYS